MNKAQLTLMTVGTCALVLAATNGAVAAPPAKGATPPMSIQPTAQRPVDTATPVPTQRAEAPKLAPNSIYAEGLGAGILYSLNYERMVLDDLAVRGGFGYVSFGASASSGGQTTSASASLQTVPITLSYTGVRAGKHALELGGGATLAFASGSGSAGVSNASASGMMPYGTAMVGYRIHPVDHAGFNFRVGAMALGGKGLSLSAPTDANAFGVIPWLYLSMGASF
ncbi:MAG: hypothetical protein ABW133_24900 [Polyangiaceae bacterium]